MLVIIFGCEKNGPKGNKQCAIPSVRDGLTPLLSGNMAGKKTLEGTKAVHLKIANGLLNVVKSFRGPQRMPRSGVPLSLSGPIVARH